MKGKPVKVLLVTEFVMFVVSALLLLLLALLLYKAELSEAAVKTGSHRHLHYNRDDRRHPDRKAEEGTKVLMGTCSGSSLFCDPVCFFCGF